MMSPLKLQVLKKFAFLPVAVVIILMIAFGSWFWLQRSYPGKVESITIGIPPNEQSTLILIAEDRGFFTRNGLNATVKTYKTALDALEGMKRSEVEIAETAEFPLVREALGKSGIAIIASIDKFYHVQLAARKDRGIETVSDLKGKKIGAARGTLTEFYLGRFLNLHGISLQDATIVYLPFAQAADALANGSVDAFQVQGKDIPLIKERLDSSKLVIWQSQSGQAGYEVISGRREFLDDHPEAIRRLLKTLEEAARYVLSNPGEARAIIQKRLNYKDAYMATMWPQHQYSLALDQSLILAMEDEARWMISNNLTTEKQVPNFRDYIYSQGLEEVKPEAVNIIH